MKYTYVIVEDIESDSQFLKKQMALYRQKYECVGTAKNVAQAVELIARKKPDFIFLDIEIPGAESKDGGFNAIDIILEKAGLTQPLNIIIISGFDEKNYLKQAINQQDYIYFIDKPIDPEDLKKALETLDGKLIPQYISIKTNKGDKKIRIDDIICLQANNKRVKIYLVGNSYTDTDTSQTLKSFCEKPELKNRFVQIHRSFIINPKHLKSHYSNKCILDGIDKPINIGRDFSAGFKGFMKSYIPSLS